jgi:hypothetical protein
MSRPDADPVADLKTLFKRAQMKRPVRFREQGALPAGIPA